MARPNPAGREATIKTVTFLVVAVVVLPSFAASSQPPDSAFARLLQKGTGEVGQGNFSAAMGDLQAALALDPRSSEAWYQLGLLLGQVADFRGAEIAFRHAIKLRPNFAQAHYSLGLTLTANPQSKLDWPGAISEFSEALKYKPDYARALNMLGAGLLATGETDAAILQLEHSIRLDPTLHDAHFNLATAFEKKDRLEDAAKEYRAAVAAKGVYPEASTALGALLFRMGKSVEAEQELEKSLKHNPDLADAHYTLARVLQSLKKTREAGIEFEEAKDLVQRAPDATQSSQLSNTGLELAAKGDLAGAAASLRKAVALKPDYGVPHYNLGLVLADMGDMTGAAQELTKAISLMPGQAKPWFDLGRVRQRQGDIAGALEAAGWAARLSPSDASIRAELASLLAANGSKPVAADSSFSVRQPAVGAFADTAENHSAFAATLSAQKDHMGAVGELLRALALRPDAIVARRNLASSYERLGDYERAILEYHKILWVVPDEVEAHLGLGSVFLEKGEAKEAVEQFRIVLAREPDSVEARTALDRASRALNPH